MGDSGQTNDGKAFSNDRLLMLMDKFAGDRNEVNLNALMTEFLNGNAGLLVPIQEPKIPTVRQTLKEDANFNVAVFEHAGKKTLGVFIDEASLLKWNPNGSPYVCLSAAALMQIAEQTGAVKILVNPNNANAFPVEREKSPEAEAKPGGGNGPMRIEVPGSPPKQELIEDLTLLYNAHESVEEAYIFMKTTASESVPTLGVYFGPGNNKSDPGIMEATEGVMVKHLIGDEVMDLTVLENPGNYRWLDGIKKCRVYKKY